MTMTKIKAANRNSPCPICRKNPAVEKYNPFCSARCADIDMGRWLKGSYAIPGEKADLTDHDPDHNPEEGF